MRDKREAEKGFGDEIPKQGLGQQSQRISEILYAKPSGSEA